MSKSERRKFIQGVLANRTPTPAQTEAEKRAAKSKKARRKGEASQKRIADDLQKIGKLVGFGEWEIYSRPVTGQGEDIIFSPPAWNRFGRLWIECKHHRRDLDTEKIFRQREQKCANKQKYGSEGIPVLIHRRDYQPIQVTMRQDDLNALSEKRPEISLHREELVPVPWESLLLLLSRKVAAAGPVEPIVEPEFDEPIEF